MNFDQLVEFLTSRMRMSHVYQPVMLLTLLRNQGTASENEIARSILADDQSQVEYYEKITRDMVGRVLRSHGIVERDKKQYHLAGWEALSAQQVEHLKRLCEAKLQEYLTKRGDLIWQHRKKSAGYIPGTVKYEVLKRAQFHCELCGISAEEKALEVDHILPRNHGGSDHPENLQALCYSCNAMKRDKDDTDFHQIRQSYQHREDGCLFCRMPHQRIIAENSLAYSVLDAFPVTEQHSLIIPKRHISTYFELGQAEVNACNQLLKDLQHNISVKDSLVSGFNIGMNNGEDAGQTIFHCHIHLIPRRKGDVENPRGGVRHLIAGKGFY